MSDIVNFKTELMKKSSDSDCFLTMPDGSVWFKYSATYRFKCEKGSGLPENVLNLPAVIFPEINEYSLEFWAMSDEDAANRVIAIKENLYLNGRIVG